MENVDRLGFPSTEGSLSYKGLYILLIVPVFSFSADLMVVQAIRDQKLSYGDLFAG